MHKELYLRIRDKVANLIEANADQIERDFCETLKLAEDPSKTIVPITIKIELSRMGTTTSHKESIAWEVKKKEKIETDEECYDPNQPDLFE